MFGSGSARRRRSCLPRWDSSWRTIVGTRSGSSSGPKRRSTVWSVGSSRDMTAATAPPARRRTLARRRLPRKIVRRRECWRRVDPTRPVRVAAAAVHGGPEPVKRLGPIAFNGKRGGQGPAWSGAAIPLAIVRRATGNDAFQQRGGTQRAALHRSAVKTATHGRRAIRRSRGRTLMAPFAAAESARRADRQARAARSTVRQPASFRAAARALTCAASSRAASRSRQNQRQLRHTRVGSNNSARAAVSAGLIRNPASASASLKRT